MQSKTLVNNKEIIIGNKKQQINRQIKSDTVLLIDKDSNNRGLINTRDAIKLAKEEGLDLVVVGQREEAPVAKIMDYGKLQYQKKKRKNQSSKNTVKEVKLRPNIGDSDYQLRIKRALGWLSKGDSVKFLVRLRGRENQHRDRATELLERIVEDLGQAAEVQSLDKRSLTVQVVPA